MTSTTVPAGRDEHAATAPKAPRGLLPVVLTATFMSALDFFIVNVAIPSMQRHLGASAGAIQWIVAGFSLALAAGLITAGRIGDIVGRRRLFALGLTLFTLASAACGLAPDVGFLIGARVAQGLAAALMGPQVLAIIRTAYDGAAQARAIALYALTMGLGAVLGQLVGGLLIKADLFGSDWRACFLINIPVGLVTVALVRRCVPESRAPQRPQLDNIGVVLVTAALVALVLPLIQGRTAGWPLWTWLSLGASAVLFAVFTTHQRRLAARNGSPVVHPALFRGRALATAMAAQLVFWAGQASFFLILALYLQVGRGLDALASGLVFTALAVGYFATSMRAHLIAARLGHQTVALGALVMALGLGLLWGGAELIGEASGAALRVLWLVPGLLVDGVGMGLVIAPLTGAVLSRVTPELVGAASGVLTTLQQVGSAVGVAALGIVFYGALGGGYAHAFGVGVLVLATLELALAALMQLLPRQR
ncbi:MFS transporter [Streptacidiphilus rugosus]|uniref:MFS transporter n=1 Tax=Streptacidiphilus rugosus TaxID=405783 RepID=UPI0005643C76|nr:MFS transporter [Streptacidiphilus rugosus]